MTTKPMTTARTVQPMIIFKVNPKGGFPGEQNINQ